MHKTAALLAAVLLGCGPFDAQADDRVTILYDAFGRPSELKKDWGFSALVEIDGKRVLFDTGNNADIFAHNAETLGVDLTHLDFVVISHRHGDHVGGLNHLLRLNPAVKIYAPHEGFGVFGSALPGTFYPRNESLPPQQRYFGGDPPETLHFGTAGPEGDFSIVGELTEVAPGFHLIALPGAWGADPPVVELSLAIDTPQGIVLMVGCSHPTIEKIVETVGGTHLLPANHREIKRIAAALHDRWQVQTIAPAHCTGEPAFEILRDIFRDRYIYAGLGTTFPLGAQRATTAGVNGSQAFFDEADVRSYRALSTAETDQRR